MTASAPVRSELRFSPLDSDRFGLRVYRIDLETIDLADLCEQIANERADVVILRISAEVANQVHRLSDKGYTAILADTLVYYAADLTRWKPRPIRNVDLNFRDANVDDLIDLRGMARRTFLGYTSHYRVNAYFPPDAVLEGYVDWAALFLSGSMTGNRVLIATDGGRIVGFICCHFKENEMEGVVGGVSDDYSGRGLYGDLIRLSQRHAVTEGCESMIVSTQVWNYAVQKVWAREGFAMSRAVNTFHLNPMLSQAAGGWQ